jgi:glycosyltransferase involved in cell wall biosynthesis
MRVSVVMCTYNGERFLQQQLDSIASQTRLPDDVIICDDGSIDSTLLILKDYAKTVKFPVTIHCNASRLGAQKNFEQAISLAQGDIIILSDQDDFWRSDKLQVLEQVLIKNPDASYAFSDAIIVNQSGKTLNQSLWSQVSFSARKRLMFSRNHEDQVRVLLGGNVVTGATMAHRASLKPIIFPIPKLWMHDEWIPFAASINGARGIPIEEPLTFYRQHSEQMIGVRRQSSFDLLKRALNSFSGDLQSYQSYKLELQKWHFPYARFKCTATCRSSSFHLLEEKVNHCALRSQLCRYSRAARLASIASEVSHGRYRLYSAGWKGAIKDLLIAKIRDLSKAHSNM